jgi:hypothetical protein
MKTERLWYVSLGSAQTITDPFLGLMRGVFWQSGRPTVKDAVFVVTWAIEHAIEVNPGGVNGPVRIAVLERQGSNFGARVVSDDELEEHRQGIEEAKNRLRGFRSDIQGSADSIADVPIAASTPDDSGIA